MPKTYFKAYANSTPVMDFRTGSLVDIVADRVSEVMTGPFDPCFLAAAICWMLENHQRRL